MDIDQIINKEFRNLSPYQPGKPIEELAREKNISKIIKLASNENPLGASPKAILALKENLNNIFYYPDPNNHDLKLAISDKFKVNHENIFIGNGSDEIQLLIANAFLNSETEVIFPKYSFANYKIISNAQKAIITESELDKNYYTDIPNILKKTTNKTRIIFIANPGNPVSTYINSKQIINLLDNISHNTLVILDEAYYEYRLEHENFDTTKLIDKYPNLIITRTFSKAYGLAGLRVGYAFGNIEIVKLLHKIKLPFTVNKLGAIGATAALKDNEHLTKTLKTNESEKKFLIQEFAKRNIPIIDSFTNFLTIELPNPNNIYQELLSQGIITRLLGNYDLTSFLRISIGTHEQNKYLINNFKS